MNAGRNTAVILSGNGSEEKSVTIFSLEATVPNGKKLQPFEQTEGLALGNETGKLSEVSPQLDLMGAWDWSI